MKVNLAVCGKFHYANYVKYIEQSCLLNQFIYSHRRSTDASVFGVASDKLVNVWIKEYLLGLHLRLFDSRGLESMFNISGELWGQLASRKWKRCDLLHIMLDGTGRMLLQRAKAENSHTVGEPLNSHPEVLYGILNDEHERLRIKRWDALPKSAMKTLEALQSCDYLLAPSTLVKKSFVKNGFDEKRTKVIPYGVDTNVFHPTSTSQGRADSDKCFRVLCVAQITPRKGHVYLLEAWKSLNLPSAELIFIGPLDSTMRPILSKYDGLFRHIPSVPHTQLKDYYSSSSVFVLPSLEDGFGYVCTEALACGLPVITTNQTGASEVLEHGKDGFIVPVRSPEMIANYLSLLYEDREKLREMSRAAISKATNELGWDTYARKLCCFYNSIDTDLG